MYVGEFHLKLTGYQNANATNMGSKNYQHALKNEEMPNVVVLSRGVSPNDYHIHAVTMLGMFQKNQSVTHPRKPNKHIPKNGEVNFRYACLGYVEIQKPGWVGEKETTSKLKPLVEKTVVLSKELT